MKIKILKALTGRYFIKTNRFLVVINSINVKTWSTVYSFHFLLHNKLGLFAFPGPGWLP